MVEVQREEEVPATRKNKNEQQMAIRSGTMTNFNAKKFEENVANLDVRMKQTSWKAKKPIESRVLSRGSSQGESNNLKPSKMLSQMSLLAINEE